MATATEKTPEQTTIPSPEKPKNLIAKLCEAMVAMGWVAKGGRNENRNYSYVRESDVLAAVREELGKRNVFVFPNVIKIDRLEHAPTKSGARQFITDVLVEWTFVDADSGETRTCTIPGCGIDDQDKGIYKAITGASKYFLLKSFFLPTGDDPEKDSDEELHEARERGKEKAQAVAASKLGTAAKLIAPDASLFYSWPKEEEGKFAHITGDVALMTLNVELLRSVGKFTRTGTGPKDGFWTIPAEKFDDLKFQLEQRKMPFALKAV